MTKQDLINRYQLNESQAEVVLDESQELIVPAGAGSGKTKTLVTKVVHLLKQGHLLDSFLVLTFTKKAANEMKARIKKELKDEGLNDLVNKIDSSDIATFDAFAYNFVKQNASYIGLDSNLELLDTSIFKIKQTEIMNSIIINIMKLNDSNDKFYQFISNYTLDTQSDRLVDNLISIYDKLVNIKPLNQFNINELIDESPLFDISKTVDEINNINSSFALDDKNDKQLRYVFSEAKVIDGLEKENIYVKSRFNWKIIDNDGDQTKIKKILEPYTLIAGKGLTNQDLVEVRTMLKDDIHTLLEILMIFEKQLIKFKQKSNKYEFRDIASFLNKILNENKNILERTKNKYKLVFVDEYQDTSLVQSDFLNLLIKENPTIKVLYVGDIKQSIYKFRDAKPETFINKLNTSKSIPLTTNYRSSAKIIDFVNQIFANILNDETKYDIDYRNNHYMKSGSTKFSLEDSSSDVFVIEQFSEDGKTDLVEEAFIVGNKIKELKEKGIVSEYNKIAILARNTGGFKIFKDVFKYLQIPVEFQIDFFLKDTYLLKLIANILSLALKINSIDKNDFERKRFNYVSLARSELFEITDFEIFNQVINLSNNKKVLNIKNEIFNKLHQLANIINTSSNIEIVNFIIKEFDVYNKIIKAPKLNEKELQIDYLYSIAQTLSDLDITSHKFVRFIDELSYNNEINIKIPVMEDITSDNVIITNIHQSKGLEYNTLFLVGLNRKFRTKNDATIEYTNTSKVIFNKKLNNDRQLLIKNIRDNAKKREKDDRLKEELRLLYVAVTRAEKALYLITTPKDNYSSLESFNDYLYEHGLLDFVKGTNVVSLNQKYKDNSYYLNLSDENKYYHNSIDQLEEIRFNYPTISFSKDIGSASINQIIDNNIRRNLRQGIKLHEEFEYGDGVISKIFKHSFSNKDPHSAIHYKELPFSYQEDSKVITGIIDLVLVYDDEVHIIDYKTKDIHNPKYLEQLTTYKNYLIKIYPEKTIKKYLYSIVKDQVISIV